MKNLAIILLTALLAFAGGWFLHAAKELEVTAIPNSKAADIATKRVKNTADSEQKQEDYSSIISDIHDTTNYASKISGKFILKDSKCAGFDFISKNSIAWSNEIDCWHPDTFKLAWLNNKTFFTKDIVHINEKSPPRVWIYEIVYYNGKRLILNDIWTGWGNFKNEKLEFIKDENPE